MSHDEHHDPALARAADPWPSIAAAFAVAAVLAGALAWRAHHDLGVMHGATHYHAIDAKLATAGRLLPGAPAELAAAGFEVVIDLRTAEEGTAEERSVVEAAGLRYINTPVTHAPRREQLTAFSAALVGERAHKVLVHCASNKRASAMVMLYRVTREGVAVDVARRDMDAIWQPSPRWNDFIAETLADPAAPVAH